MAQTVMTLRTLIGNGWTFQHQAVPDDPDGETIKRQWSHRVRGQRW